MHKLTFAGLQNVWHVTDFEEFLKTLKDKSTLLFVRSLDQKVTIETALLKEGFRVKPFTMHGPVSSLDNNDVLILSYNQACGFRVPADQVAFYYAPSFEVLQQAQARAEPFVGQADGLLYSANAYVYHPFPKLSM